LKGRFVVKVMIIFFTAWEHLQVAERILSVLKHFISESAGCAI